MKAGTEYGERLKKVFAKLRRSAAKPDVPDLEDPLRCLAAAIFGLETSEEEAQSATNRALSAMVDWNDIRVSTSSELHEAIGDGIPQGLKRCQQLIDALQAIYREENRLSLERLKNMGLREARQYLEMLLMGDEYVVAFVVLWGLGGHAIPANDVLLCALRDADLVHPDASRAEIQAFLERHVSAAEAKEFCIVMRSLTKREDVKTSKRRNVKT